MSIKPPIPNGINSQLFPALLERIQPVDGKPLRVLDLGPASAATVAFFSQFRCSLHFADLAVAALHPPVRTQDEEELDARSVEAELAGHFRALLDLPKGSVFDICLFWDYLNHLSDAEVRAFSLALQPHLHSSSRGHGFAVLNRNAQLYHQSYGVLADNLLVVNAVNKVSLLACPHSQSGLNNLLVGMEVNRSVLRTDGRLEVLMRTNTGS